MLSSSAPTIDPGQILGAALSLPPVSMAIAAIIALGISFTPRWNARRQDRAGVDPTAAPLVAARHSREHRALGGTAIAVIIFFLAENLVTGYVLNLSDVVSWWRYATPLFAASAGLAVVLAIIVSRGSTRPERPVISATRRTWLTFSSRIGLIGAVLALLAVTLTTIATGLASSTIGDGPHVFLEIGIPNETIDPIRPWFYGWAYGVPVLICVALLATVSAIALRANSARSFLNPETVTAEQRERREIAAGIMSVATSSALLALAGAWRFIADAGSTTQLIVQGDGGSDSYEAVWRYAELAAIGGRLAPALEISAFVMLLLVTAHLARGSRAAASTESADLEAVR